MGFAHRSICGPTANDAATTSLTGRRRSLQRADDQTLPGHLDHLFGDGPHLIDLEDALDLLRHVGYAGRVDDGALGDEGRRDFLSGQ